MDKELAEFQEKAMTFAVNSSSTNEGRNFKKSEKGSRYK
jgi:hypothetical protein